MTEAVPTELLKYRITSSSYDEDLLPGDDPSAFVTRLPFDLRQGRDLIGQAHAFLIRVADAERRGFSVAEVFDSDQDLHELYCAIYDEKTDEIKETLADASALRNVLYIETVKVVSSRRGRQLGLHFVERIRELNAHGCAVVALNTRPLTKEETKYPDWVDADVFDGSFRCSGTEARDKLRAYWSRLGFKSVTNTDFMIFDMSDEPPKL